MKIGNLEIYGVIYKVINNINGKVYIGQTALKRGFNDRYQCKGVGTERIYYRHKNLKKNGFGYNPHLLNAFEKYGIENFTTIEVFDIAFSKIELDIKELTYIQLYDSYKNGYNRCSGGDTNRGYENKKGKDSPCSKKIVQLDLKGNYIKTWGSLSDASNELKICRSDICSTCKRKKKSAGGYIWVYEEDYDENKTYTYTNKQGEYNKRKVAQLSKDGEIIKIWDSIADAERCLHISHISDRCKGKRTKNGDYKWKYYDEVV